MGLSPLKKRTGLCVAEWLLPWPTADVRVGDGTLEKERGAVVAAPLSE